MSKAEDDAIFIGTSVKKEQFLLRLTNRRGLGTGKTVSLQILAEGFSDAGVPVVAADIKGDLSGLAEKGVSKPFLEERAGDGRRSRRAPTRSPMRSASLSRGRLVRRYRASWSVSCEGVSAANRGHENGRE